MTLLNDTPECIRPDLMHCFNLGIGGDLASSGLLAACRMGLFCDDVTDGKLRQSSLDAAYDKFDTWCSLNQKTSSVKSFELKKFHVKTMLVLASAHFLG